MPVPPHQFCCYVQQVRIYWRNHTAVVIEAQYPLDLLLLEFRHLQFSWYIKTECAWDSRTVRWSDYNLAFVFLRRALHQPKLTAQSEALHIEFLSLLWVDPLPVVRTPVEGIVVVHNNQSAELMIHVKELMQQTNHSIYCDGLQAAEVVQQFLPCTDLPTSLQSWHQESRAHPSISASIVAAALHEPHAHSSGSPEHNSECPKVVRRVVGENKGP